MADFYLGRTSRRNLKGVHPDLVRVIARAIEITTLDFGVTEGVRTIGKQKDYFDNGKSWTMDSLHLLQEDDYGHAVDLYCRDPQGRVTWKHRFFRPVIQAIITAAIELGVQVRFGGLWRDTQDSPHVELGE